jgi:hypothetical protein
MNVGPAIPYTELTVGQKYRVEFIPIKDGNGYFKMSPFIGTLLGINEIPDYRGGVRTMASFNNILLKAHKYPANVTSDVDVKTHTFHDIAETRIIKRQFTEQLPIPEILTRKYVLPMANGGKSRKGKSKSKKTRKNNALAGRHAKKQKSV